MKENLNIALVQSILHWEDITANLAMFKDKLAHLKGNADIIVLPEMFSTGFSMEPAKLAEKMNGRSLTWMLEQAKILNSVITGSLIIHENNSYYNRLIWARPDGTYEKYDKRHLFSMAGEDKVYAPGQSKLLVECKGWKICPMICYDLRFPVWIRNVENYDLLIFVANWPEKRIHHWKALLPARSIENQSYALGVNRVGMDGNEFTYTGSSMAIGPMGNSLIEIQNEEKIEIITLDYEEITKVRRYMPFLADRDGFEIS